MTAASEVGGLSGMGAPVRRVFIGKGERLDVQRGRRACLPPGGIAAVIPLDPALREGGYGHEVSLVLESRDGMSRSASRIRPTYIG